MVVTPYVCDVSDIISCNVWPSMIELSDEKGASKGSRNVAFI